MFNNFNIETNGEIFFVNKIKDEIDIIFDIGSRDDSLFLSFEKEVHYFEPVPNFLEELKQKNNKNKKSFFNAFGLSDTDTVLPYYVNFQSFVDRSNSQGSSSKIELIVKKAIDYINDNRINNIGLIKIDTEGFELNVMKGFGEKLNIVKYIQFEYGGTYLDKGLKLIDVVNYLKNHGFSDFSYLGGEVLTPITDFTDHYNYSNIVCKNKKYE